MTNEEIKQECDALYEQNKRTGARLEELRETCKHEDSFEGSFSWRAGSIIPAKFCAYCNKILSTSINKNTHGTKGNH